MNIWYKLGFFLSLIMVVCISYAGQVYKWTDSQGNVHFSDIPHEGAEIITIPDTQSYSPPTPVTPQISEPQESTPKPQKHVYSEVVIESPANGATIRNNQGFVAVRVKVVPKLFRGDELQMFYDNASIGEPQTDLSFKINGMYRGTHVLKVQVIDANGNVIATSEPVTIYVFRSYVGMGKKKPS